MDKKTKSSRTITELEQLFEKLLLRIAKLEKNSNNSSKSPLSGLIMPRPDRSVGSDGEIIKPGAQPGH